MYPLSLERQYSNLWKSEISKFAEEINSKVLTKVKEYTSTSEARADSFFYTPVVRLDVSDLRGLLIQLKDQYGDFVPRKEFESQIKRNVHLIDAWSRDKTNEFVKKQYGNMNSPPIAGVVGGNRSDFRVPAIKIPEKESPQIWDKVNQIIKEQTNLASNAFRDHFEAVQKIVTDGLSKGLKYEDIAAKIKAATGISERRAEFWATDQTGKFFNQQSRLRQTKAGFPGYFWRTQKDSRVRDSHYHVADKFYTWDSPPLVQRKGGLAAHLEPGDDWRCRCFREPSWGPKGTVPKVSNTPKSPSQIQLPPRPQPKKIITIADSISLNLPDPTIQANIQKTLSDLDSILRFPPDRATASVHYLSGAILRKNISGLFNPNTNRIELNGSQAFKEIHQSTFVHEFGHMMDYNWIGKPGRYESASPEFSEFKKVVQDTELFKRLKKIGMTGKMLIPQNQLSIPLNSTQRKLIPYFLSTEELFARATELWTAKKTNSQNLIAQIQKKGNMNFVNHYWDEKDFEPVEDALDKIFKKLGYLK
ncbi:phage minor head protein [Leptospira kirschneri]|uniref:phage minor head protein n=1 Tax=Leptospira kirschneri TaxID=29507 RepID=UPI00398B8EDA